MNYDQEDDDAFDGPDAITEDDEGAESQMSMGEDEEQLWHTLYGLGETTTENDSSGRGNGIRVIRLNHFEYLWRGAALLRQFRTERQEEPQPDDSDEAVFAEHPRKARRRRSPPPPVSSPQEAGQNLLMSGEFGRIGHKTTSRRKNINVAKMLNNLPVNFRSACYKEDISSNLIPNCNGVAVASYDSNIYSGQYSADSSLYYTCAQDYRLRVYDMKAGPVPANPGTESYQTAENGHTSTMKVIKTIQGHLGRWTITDSHLSPDDQRIIYSSITPTVYMANTLDTSTTQIPIPFADPITRSRSVWGMGDSFGIWSCRFSADGNEIVAGGDGNLFVYDLLANRRTVKITAHDADVNSCCWADTASGNVLVSASDDTFIKIWDRRSLAGQKPSGVLLGHTEGITYVSAKGDGRYVISNGKDQVLRLWDLRKMRTNAEFDKVSHRQYGTNFDYRYSRYRGTRPAHPLDCSVMAYRGHSVLRTLIRCHFSPLETTGAQYLYSGSADGKIHIWSLDGRIVQVLNRAKMSTVPFDPSEAEPPGGDGRQFGVCVRDVSWNSQEPVLMSTGWERVIGGSIIARHEWKGLSKMRGSLEDWVEKNRQEQGT